jgi:transcriptional regulator with XRE-family HTH domain
MAFKNIGKALTLLRRRAGLSQAELAERCSIGRSQVSKYEAGKEIMKLDTLEKILAELHVKPDYFFRLTGLLDESPLPRRGFLPDQIDERRLIAAFENLHAAIDELRQVVERSIDPAIRFAKLIDDAAASRTTERDLLES